jgi:predicted Zn-dependent protease
MSRTPGVSGDVVSANLIVNGQEVGNQSNVVTDPTVGAWTMPVTDITPGSEMYLLLTGVQSGGVTAQLPLASVLAATLPFNSIPPSGVATWDLRVINIASTQTITIGTNTGWTLVGTMTVANNTWRDFVVSVNQFGACTLTSVGTGTYS